MWAGASFQVEYFVYGITLMTFGFNFSQALILTVIAQLLGMFAALEGLAPTFSVPGWLTLVATPTHGADVSIFSGTGVAGIAYYLLARRELNGTDVEAAAS